MSCHFALCRFKFFSSKVVGQHLSLPILNDPIRSNGCELIFPHREVNNLSLAQTHFPSWLFIIEDQVTRGVLISTCENRLLWEIRPTADRDQT